MKVCMDIQSAIGPRAGVGRYTHQLAQHLAATPDALDLKVFYFDFKRLGSPFSLPGVEQRAVQWCPGRLVQKVWKEWRWPPYEWFAGAADVYHFPNFIIPPLRKGKKVVTVHDVTFLRHPETVEQKNYRYLSTRLEQTVQVADHIIVVSDFSRQEVLEHYAVDADRITAIHLGISQPFDIVPESRIQAVRKMLGLERPYLLFVGTVEPRKNIPFLIDVFEAMDHFDGDLVIAGMKGWKYEESLQRINSSKKGDRIHYLEFVDESHLPGLYAGAEIFVFPSHYEGFGFPPLEAMSCGTPVISSAGGALPETVGNAGVIIDRGTVEAWVHAVETMLHDTAQRDIFRKIGLEHAGHFDWARTARKTVDVYRRVAGENTV